MQALPLSLEVWFEAEQEWCTLHSCELSVLQQEDWSSSIHLHSPDLPAPHVVRLTTMLWRPLASGSCDTQPSLPRKRDSVPGNVLKADSMPVATPAQLLPMPALKADDAAESELFSSSSPTKQPVLHCGPRSGDAWPGRKADAATQVGTSAFKRSRDGSPIADGARVGASMLLPAGFADLQDCPVKATVPVRSAPATSYDSASPPSSSTPPTASTPDQAHQQCAAHECGSRLEATAEAAAPCSAPTASQQHSHAVPTCGSNKRSLAHCGFCGLAERYTPPGGRLRQGCFHCEKHMSMFDKFFRSKAKTSEPRPAPNLTFGCDAYRWGIQNAISQGLLHCAQSITDVHKLGRLLFGPDWLEVNGPLASFRVHHRGQKRQAQDRTHTQTAQRSAGAVQSDRHKDAEGPAAGAGAGMPAAGAGRAERQPRGSAVEAMKRIAAGGSATCMQNCTDALAFAAPKHAKQQRKAAGVPTGGSHRAHAAQQQPQAHCRASQGKQRRTVQPCSCTFCVAQHKCNTAAHVRAVARHAFGQAADVAWLQRYLQRSIEDAPHSGALHNPLWCVRAGSQRAALAMLLADSWDCTERPWPRQLLHVSWDETQQLKRVFGGGATQCACPSQAGHAAQPPVQPSDAGNAESAEVHRAAPHKDTCNVNVGSSKPQWIQRKVVRLAPVSQRVGKSAVHERSDVAAEKPGRVCVTGTGRLWPSQSEADEVVELCKQRLLQLQQAQGSTKGLKHGCSHAGKCET